MPLATPVYEIDEKTFQAQIVDLAKTLGWLHYHTHDSRRSAPGFPDLVLVRDRTIFVEVKREKGKLSDAQRDWIRALLAAHAEVYVCRPRDLEALGAVLAWRGDPRMYEHSGSAYAGWRALRAVVLSETA